MATKKKSPKTKAPTTASLPSPVAELAAPVAELAAPVAELAAPVAELAAPPVSTPVAQAPLDHDTVARMAFTIWKARGGDARENWAEAERRLNP